MDKRKNGNAAVSINVYKKLFHICIQILKRRTCAFLCIFWTALRTIIGCALSLLVTRMWLLLCCTICRYFKGKPGRVVGTCWSWKNHSVYASSYLYEKLGHDLCRVLPAEHSLNVCDVTSKVVTKLEGQSSKITLEFWKVAYPIIIYDQRCRTIFGQSVKTS